MKLRVLLLVLCACGPRDLLVAELPPGDGGMMMGPDVPCSDVSECPANQYCEKTSCSSAVGVCRFRPPFCKPQLDPVCGCNGVTYWNDCLMFQSGATRGADGVCVAPVTCTTSASCSDSTAFCAFLLPSASSCGAVPTGACWVVPSSCPAPTAEEGGWEACSGAPMCGGLCRAVQSGGVRRSVNFCP